MLDAGEGAVDGAQRQARLEEQAVAPARAEHKAGVGVAERIGEPDGPGAQRGHLGSSFEHPRTLLGPQEDIPYKIRDYDCIFDSIFLYAVSYILLEQMFRWEIFLVRSRQRCCLISRVVYVV